jgi:exopolysaccharide production protein ExoQ
MPPIVALISCIGFVGVLLYIEHSRSREASLALWVPTFWMLICASRPLGGWFDSISISSEASVEGIEAGSPLDRLVLSILIIVALLILFRRRINWSWILKDNYWLILLFLYLGISILWSDIPYVSFKRWFRSTGAVVVALVVLSERKPLQALESIIRRCAYVLVPLSLMLIKYFPHLGRGYARWSGLEMWTGVTLQKNCLGQLCALSAFFLIWALLREWRSGNLLRNRSQTIVDALVLSITFFLLGGPSSYSRSATSESILIIGIALLLLLYRRETLARTIARNLKALTISLTMMYMLLYDSIIRIVTSIVQRDETLTGRTDIWRPLLAFASHNPLFGVGYGGFWAPGNRELEELFSYNFILNQAHNGYLAIYVELGFVGIAVLIVFLLAYCGRVRRHLNYSFEWGAYGICLLPMALIYNNSEVSFLQSSSYLWCTMVFLTIVFSAPCLHTRGNLLCPEGKSHAELGKQNSCPKC